MLLPELSHKLRAGDHQSAIDSENRSLEFSLLLTVPAAVALLIASTPIVRVLFERGAFEASDAEATAALLSAYAIGLPAFVLVKVFHPSYFARENTRTPMLFALSGMAANVVSSFLLFLRLGPVGIPPCGISFGLAQRGASFCSGSSTAPRSHSTRPSGAATPPFSSPAS